MPRYQYACSNLECEYEVELTHSVSDVNKARLCRVCGYEMRRVITASATHFKGTGWGKDGA